MSQTPLDREGANPQQATVAFGWYDPTFTPYVGAGARPFRLNANGEIMMAVSAADETPGDEVEFITADVGTEAAALPNFPTPRGLRIQVPETAAAALYIGDDETVTTSGDNRGWKVDKDTDDAFDIDNANKLFAIASSPIKVILHASRKTT